MVMVPVPNSSLACGVIGTGRIKPRSARPGAIPNLGPVLTLATTNVTRATPTSGSGACTIPAAAASPVGGTGKTVCAQYLLKEIQQHAKDIKSSVATAYVNAGRTRSPYYSLLEIEKQLGITVPDVGWQFFRLKTTFENLLKEKAVVIAIDEVESILFKEKEPLIYYLNRQPNTTLILISNKLSQATQLPERCLSTLQPMTINFGLYAQDDALKILKERAEHAFKPGSISDELLVAVAKATAEMGDIRLGISMLLTAGQTAEQNGQTTINLKDVELAIDNAQKIKDLTQMNIISKRIKKQTGKTIDF